MDIAEIAMVLNTIQAEVITPQLFQETALKAGKFIKQLNQEQQMMLYGLFKQASVGENTSPEPGQENLVDYYKWQAWTSFKGFPQSDAARAYVYFVNQFESSLAPSSIEEKVEQHGMGPTVSTLYCEYDSSLKWKQNQKLFEAVVNGDIEIAKLCILEGFDVNGVDEKQKLTPLHYASDRGHLEMCALLLENGANVNSVDGDLQTPLMYAVLCDYPNIIKLLLEHGAEKSIRNSDGETVLDFPDLSSEILSLLQ